ASPETATDANYADIERVIAHEYFHNWTGNRITCRDWFQLCLKEGLTVFRDQEFSSDERSRPVHRISEVRTLRARQFSEDAGPLAHPVRPRQYREINNFYTATVYEKGAEIVRMLKTLLGEADFRRGMDLYFERCDGTAATVEDFLAAFTEATGRDLSQFARWYEQAGTPHVTVTGAYDETARTYRLEFTQETPSTPGQPTKEPVVIPVVLGLVAADGSATTAEATSAGNGLFVLDRASGAVTFDNVASPPVPSVFRGFSAPVKVALDLADDELLVLLRHDSDPFNRWEAGQTVAMRLLVRLARSANAGLDAADSLAAALLAFLDQEGERDPAFAALMLALPSESEIAQEIGADVDPDAIYRARKRVRASIGQHLRDRLLDLRHRLASSSPYSPDAASAGRRSLRNVALDLIAAGDPDRGERLADELLATATNMTDRLAALAVLTTIPGDVREQAVARFAERYRDEPLVLDKWLALQAMIPESDTLERVRGLMGHPSFSITNPNRVRSLVGSFALNNPTQFNRADGAGYAFLADIALTLDKANPQVAARLLTAFGPWKTMEPHRRAQARAALERISRAQDLSPDVGDIVQRSLA
ncbi:MAG TPA: aminopeptidase N, partial [Beijerinckiaceae bacterium]